jgi:hypothetical protein
MRKIYKLLKNREVKIAICPMNICGLSDSSDFFIYLNPAEDIIPTLIHECFHLLILQGKIKIKLLKYADDDETNEETREDEARENREEKVVELEKFCKKFLDHYHGIKLLKLLMQNLTSRTKTGDRRYDI